MRPKTDCQTLSAPSKDSHDLKSPGKPPLVNKDNESCKPTKEVLKISVLGVSVNCSDIKLFQQSNMAGCRFIPTVNVPATYMTV